MIGGLDHDGKPFLGTVGMIGTAYTDDHVATGAVQACQLRTFAQQLTQQHRKVGGGRLNTGYPAQDLVTTWRDLCFGSGTPRT